MERNYEAWGNFHIKPVFKFSQFSLILLILSVSPLVQKLFSTLFTVWTVSLVCTLYAFLSISSIMILSHRNYYRRIRETTWIFFFLFLFCRSQIFLRKKKIITGIASRNLRFTERRQNSAGRNNIFFCFILCLRNLVLRFFFFIMFFSFLMLLVISIDFLWGFFLAAEGNNVYKNYRVRYWKRLMT